VKDKLKTFKEMAEYPPVPGDPKPIPKDKIWHRIIIWFFTIIAFPILLPIIAVASVLWLIETGRAKRIIDKINAKSKVQ